MTYDPKDPRDNPFAPEPKHKRKPPKRDVVTIDADALTPSQIARLRKHAGVGRVERRGHVLVIRPRGDLQAVDTLVAQMQAEPRDYAGEPWDELPVDVRLRLLAKAIGLIDMNGKVKKNTRKAM